MVQTFSVAHQHLKALATEELAHVLESYHYIRGLIFAVSAAPEIPMPEQWLVWTFRQRGQLHSTEQADKLTDTLMTLLQQQLQEMRDELVRFPPEYSYSKNAQSPASQWLTGLLAGHTRLEDIWQLAWQRKAEAKPEDLNQLRRDLSHCLRMFSTFADLSLAQQQAKQAGNDALIEKLPKIYGSLSQALKKYVAISGQLAGFLPDQFETFAQPVSSDR